MNIFLNMMRSLNEEDKDELNEIKQMMMLNSWIEKSLL